MLTQQPLFVSVVRILAPPVSIHKSTAQLVLHLNCTMTTNVRIFVPQQCTNQEVTVLTALVCAVLVEMPLTAFHVQQITTQMELVCWPPIALPTHFQIRHK